MKTMSSGLEETSPFFVFDAKGGEVNKGEDDM